MELVKEKTQTKKKKRDKEKSAELSSTNENKEFSEIKLSEDTQCLGDSEEIERDVNQPEQHGNQFIAGISDDHTIIKEAIQEAEIRNAVQDRMNEISYTECKLGGKSNFTETENEAVQSHNKEVQIQEQDKTNEKCPEEKKTAISNDYVENTVQQSAGQIQTHEKERSVVIDVAESSNEFQKLLKLNKELANTIQLVELSEVELSKEKVIPKVQFSAIKPYTVSQLSALYHNGELDTLNDFVSHYVEAELKGSTIKQHPLYELLSNYLRVKEKITGNNLEIQQIRKEYRDLQSVLWTIEIGTVSARGECQDGNFVSISHNYDKSVFHRSVFQSIVRILVNIQKLIYENHTLYSYSAEEYRLQIELYLQTIITNCLNVTQLDKNAPVALTLQSEPLHLKPYLGEVRICISILFAFQRKLVREMQFVKETRVWLSQLVALLLRLANYQDHLFILNHVLRCPAGVSTWAASFIQTPLALNAQESPFSNYQVNHVLTILATVLSPITSRDRFLEDISQSKDMAADALWVMVDSEGEDEDSDGTGLKENDLVSLLNQLPLDDLFRNTLHVKKRNFQDIYEPSSLTEQHILRYLAFSTSLLKILHTGLKTYGQPRYNQFSKRLSRFIRHVAQYATDQWEIFLKLQTLEDRAMLERLQVEYDAFFLRTVYYLYSSQKLGAWQFLAVIPYNMIKLKTLWKIFYFLHSVDNQAEAILDPLDEEDYSRKIWEVELRIQFEEKLTILEDAEVYYLLNTFANMALARSQEDMDFVYSATIDLLKVGFISEQTQDSCSKSARILLSHLTSKYPHLLSNILKDVKENIDKIGSFALYLYEELPLSIWKITEDDMEIISRLLLQNPVNSTENMLSRMILSRLNWNEISYEIHCQVALLVVVATCQEPCIENWSWQTILRLKLHISDNSFKEIGRVQELESYDALQRGIKDQLPIASFVSVLMTTWGHLVPLICTRGLSQLLFLQTIQKHEAVLFALYQIVPLFINCQECFINCENFQDILLNLLNADRGYISMAKSLVYSQNMTVLEQFGNMIETQIVNFAYYKLESPRCLVRLWMNSLVSISGWYRDMGIMYLLNVIIRTAFTYPEAMEVVHGILRERQQLGTPQENAGTMGFLFKWVSNSSTSGSLISNSLSNYTWLAYVMINIEHEERELRPGLWNEILVQLSKQKGKVNVDQAIKKAASIVKVPSFTSGYLCLYRWAQQALDTPLDHPILPLLWQNFFSLYLARITSTSHAEKSCVGERFFDGLVNFAFLKKIKRRLQESVEYFNSKLDTKNDDSINSERKQFYKNCHGIFRAFSLWLEEPRLQEDGLLLRSLPPQYEPNILLHIVQGIRTPWYEFLDREKLIREQQLCIRMWRVANFREKSNVNQPLLNAGSRVESDDPVERILRRLSSYDSPKPPPNIVLAAPVIPKILFGNSEEMFKFLEPCFKTLGQFARDHNLKVSEQKALDCGYKELVPQLYRSVLNKVKKKVPCKMRNQTVHCSGAAVIILEVQEARLNERIDHQVQTNRATYESLLTNVLQSSSINLCTAAVILQQTIKILQTQLPCNPATAELGVELFYHILSLLNEETNAFPPTKTLFSCCLEKLGQSHISGVEYEMPRLLQKILKESNLGGYLAPHFSPSKVGTSNLLLMYSTICKEIGSQYDVTFALLSKFEIESWLQTKQPSLPQRSQFVNSVMTALMLLGFNPPVESLTLHNLYRKHLLIIFEYQFPEHYCEVLLLLLKASNGNPETNLVSLDVWMDVLNCLAKPASLDFKASFRDQFKYYAQHQRLLQHEQLLNTSELLGRHFMQERLQYGLYGLYPKCRSYMDVFVLFLGMIGHGIVTSMITVHQDLPSDKLCDKIWPPLRDMFSPWLVPYSMQNLKDNMAAWIQQLADDRSVLLPWINADGGFASKVLGSFRECIGFVLHVVPGSNCMLSYIWQWYVSCYAHTSVKDYILRPVHEVFVTFSWNNFWPSTVDIELMLRVADQYLPECHSFLGLIFISIPWSEWLKNFAASSAQLQSRVHQCFLNLAVKLCNEPNVRKNYPEQAKSLLVQAENFHWCSLEATLYRHVMDWYVMSCDASVIFKGDPLDLDYRVLHFLKTVSSYPYLGETLDKRLIYLKTIVKLLSVYTDRNRSHIQRKYPEISVLASRLLNDIESVASSEEEMVILLGETLCILNIENIKEPCMTAFLKWVENKPGDGIVIRGLLKTVGVAVKDLECLAIVYEASIEAYFTNTVSNDFQPTWMEVGGLLNILIARHTDLEQIILTKGSLLLLNALIVQRMLKFSDTGILINHCLDWMANIKVSCELMETKVPLLWSNFLTLIERHSDKDETFCALSLHKFSQILLETAEDKGSAKWGRGLLSAIGLGGKGSLSMAFRFLCRAIAGYVLAQLPDMKGEAQIIRRVPNAPAKVGQPGGNSECIKVLLTLDFGQSQGRIKECAELALKQIQDPTNSLHTAKNFLELLLKQFYTKPYLTDIG